MTGHWAWRLAICVVLLVGAALFSDTGNEVPRAIKFAVIYLAGFVGAVLLGPKRRKVRGP